MASKDDRKKHPPREAPPSLMGDAAAAAAAAASMPGAFPQGGIEMTPPEQRIQDKIQKMDGTKTRPGSVAMNGPGMPTGKNSANSKNKNSDYSADRSFIDDSPINDNTCQRLPPPDEKWRDDTYEYEKKWVFRIMVGVLVTLCILIPVVVHYLQETDEGLPTALVEDDEGLDPLLVIPGLSPATVQAIVTDHHSPQFMAFLWIKLDPHLKDYEDWRIEQRFAMGVLYYSWGGTSWTFRFQTWMSYWKAECEWMGGQNLDRPYCNDDGQVVALYMDDLFAKVGILPAEIELLPHLELLDLSHSHLHGDLDTFFSLLPQNLSQVLPNLEQLVLVDSEIDGTIPAQALSTLSSTLKVLELSTNKMTGSVPTELGLLTKLETLSLTKNALTGSLPDELGFLTMTSLTSFQVDLNTDLEPTLPSGFCQEESLVTELVTDWCPSVEECCFN